MSSTDHVESMLFRTGIRFDQVDPSTWVLQLDNRHRSRIVVRVEDPIVLFSMPLGDLDEQVTEREALFRTLLELNTDFTHGAYAIEGERLVLSGVLQLGNLDADQFQAVIDDLTMTLDNHLEKLSNWKLSARSIVEA